MPRMGRTWPVSSSQIDAPGKILPVLFDSASSLQVVGGTFGTNYGSTSPLSWSHTIAGNCLVVPYIAESATNPSTALTAQVGSTNMNSLSFGQYYFLNYVGINYYVYIGMLAVLNPPQGTQTVTLSWPSGIGGFLSAGSLSYFNVASFGAVATNLGPALATVTVASAPRERCVNIIGGWNNTPVGYSKNKVIGPWGPNPSERTGVIGDAAGASSVTFSRTDSDTVTGSIALALSPVLPEIPMQVPVSVMTRSRLY